MKKRSLSNKQNSRYKLLPYVARISNEILSPYSSANFWSNSTWVTIRVGIPDEKAKLACCGDLRQLIVTSILSNLNGCSPAAYPLIPPYSAPNWYDANTNGPMMRIFCRAGEGYNLAVRGENVVLEPVNPESDYQASMHASRSITFIIINACIYIWWYVVYNIYIYTHTWLYIFLR